jgi:hypothetical protein
VLQFKQLPLERVIEKDELQTQVPLMNELIVGSHEQVEELAFQVKVRMQSQALLVTVPTA